MNRLRTNPICCLYPTPSCVPSLPPPSHHHHHRYIYEVWIHFPAFLVLYFSTRKRFPFGNAVLSSISHRLFPSIVLVHIGSVVHLVPRFDCNSHIFNPLKEKITIKIQICTISAPLFRAIPHSMSSVLLPSHRVDQHNERASASVIKLCGQRLLGGWVGEGWRSGFIIQTGDMHKTLLVVVVSVCRCPWLCNNKQSSFAAALLRDSANDCHSSTR